MEKVIATVVIIVLTLGLISYAIIGQMGGFKDTSDAVTVEQAKLSAVMENSDLVTGSSVKNYIKQGEVLGYEVYMTSNDAQNEITWNNYSSKIEESALYSIEKIFKTGTASSIDYIIVTAWNPA